MGCRTRVMSNVYDPTREITYGRGNLSLHVGQPAAHRNHAATAIWTGSSRISTARSTS